MRKKDTAAVVRTMFVVYVKFISKGTAPYWVATFSSPRGISSLDHKTFNISQK